MTIGNQPISSEPVSGVMPGDLGIIGNCTTAQGSQGVTAAGTTTVDAVIRTAQAQQPAIVAAPLGQSGTAQGQGAAAVGSVGVVAIGRPAQGQTVAAAGMAYAFLAADVTTSQSQSPSGLVLPELVFDPSQAGHVHYQDTPVPVWDATYPNVKIEPVKVGKAWPMPGFATGATSQVGPAYAYAIDVQLVGHAQVRGVAARSAVAFGFGKWRNRGAAQVRVVSVVSQGCVSLVQAQGEQRAADPANVHLQGLQAHAQAGMATASGVQNPTEEELIQMIYQAQHVYFAQRAA